MIIAVSQGYRYTIEDNAMPFDYTKKLGLLIKKTNLDTQKIGNVLENFWDSHSRLLAPRQAGNSLILPEDLFVGSSRDAILYFRKCRPTVCREEACLDHLHGYGRPSV